ncbi:MAG: hypothetical protein LBE84_07800 [Planctomycetota bacterium]|jgi:hypothetical protein|nr:hypothetical protein [Planctomycetota bacterium]
MSGDLFCDMLREAQRDRQLVCIFRDPVDLRRFAVGFVEAVSENDYTLQQVDPDGNPDGVDVGAIDDIVEIRRETRYVRQIALMMDKESNDDVRPAGGWNGNPNPESCLEEALRRSLQEKLVVNVLLATGEDELRFHGIVREISETHVRLDVLTDDGEPDGASAIRLDDIAGLQMNSRDEWKVALFNRHRMHLYL